MRNIRACFAAFGYDLSDYTDEEIVEGIEQYAQVVNASKVTLQQAADALTMMVNALPKLGKDEA